MEITGRFDDHISLTADEERILKEAKQLLASKSDYGAGADFRVAFVFEIMDGYCDHCGSGGDTACYCTRDD